MMSGSPGRAGGSFSRGGSPSQKKVRRKKQEYHKHRARLPGDEAPLDLEALKSRTIQSLDRLGHQVFFPDQGYGLQDWLRSLNVLLDDFETKAAPLVTIPQGYISKRQEVVDRLSRPPEFPELDSAIAQAKSEEERLSAALERHGAAHVSAKLISLNRQRDQLAAELDRVRARLSEKEAEPRHIGFFGRILGKKEPPSSRHEIDVSRAEEQLIYLESQLKALEEEEMSHQENKEKLVLARERLADLEAKKVERMQFVEERQEAAKLLANEISSIEPS